MRLYRRILARMAMITTLLASTAAVMAAVSPVASAAPANGKDGWIRIALCIVDEIGAPANELLDLLIADLLLRPASNKLGDGFDGARFFRGRAGLHDIVHALADLLRRAEGHGSPLHQFA